MVRADRKGYLSRLDAELVGRASVLLGAGRDRVEDAVDPAVGIVLKAKPGSSLSAGDPVLELHYREQAKLDAALVLARRAITIGDEAPTLRAIIVGEVR
jgi:thymidine phosphorylase